MIKPLLTIAATAMAMSAAATEVTIWEGTCDLGTDWSNSLGVNSSEFSVLDNESAVLNIQYTLNADCEYWQYKPCSNGEGWTPLNIAAELGNDYNCISLETNSSSTNLTLAAEDIATLKANGLRIQGYGVTLTKIVYNTDADIDTSILWEGEATISGWNQACVISASKVKVGDILTYTVSEAGADNAQIIVKNSSWGNLVGTTKIVHGNLALGSFEVGVTQQMLDNCGGSIFLQGDGGVTFTKVQITGSFDATDVIAYGSRVPGVNVFTTIPEGTTQIAVEYETEPSWSQICSSNWSDLALESKADGNIVTYNLTEAAITAINEKSELVVNTSSNVVKVYIPSTTSVESTLVADDAIVSVYNIMGQAIREGVAKSEATTGLPAGFYIVGGKKVLVK